MTGSGVGDGNDVLPKDCTSTRGGDAVKLSYLLSCFIAREGDLPPEQCDWYTLPPQPGSAAATAKQEAFADGRAQVPQDGASRPAARIRSAGSRGSRTRSRRSSGAEALGSGRLALLAAAAGGVRGRRSGPRRRSPWASVLVDSVAPTGACSDWTEGTRAERLATIEEIREQINLKDSAVQTPELSDKAAYRVLDSSARGRSRAASGSTSCTRAPTASPRSPRTRRGGRCGSS